MLEYIVKMINILGSLYKLCIPSLYKSYVMNSAPVHFTSVVVQGVLYQNTRNVIVVFILQRFNSRFDLRNYFE